MANRYMEAAENAANLTNKQLEKDLAMICPLNDIKLGKLLPLKRDKVAFAKMMAIVEKETEEDKQLAFLSENLHTAGKVVFKVLKYFL